MLKFAICDDMVTEAEALKAQVVAARTYTLHKMQNGGSPRHPDADTCDDITCCKAYKGQEAAAAELGMSAETYEQKLRNAVAQTDGEVILYGGEPILENLICVAPVIRK